MSLMHVFLGTLAATGLSGHGHMLMIMCRTRTVVLFHEGFENRLMLTATPDACVDDDVDDDDDDGDGGCDQDGEACSDADASLSLS